MSRINQLRASGRSCGGTGYAAVAAVSWNDKLLAASSVHSADMAARNYFSHTGSDGRNGGQRITSAGYRWRMWAENIAAGQTSVNQAMQSWIDSPAHCAALMSNSAAEVGVSCAHTDTGSYKYYWTMNFGAPY